MSAPSLRGHCGSYSGLWQGTGGCVWVSVGNCQGLDHHLACGLLFTFPHPNTPPYLIGRARSAVAVGRMTGRSVHR